MPEIINKAKVKAIRLLVRFAGMLMPSRRPSDDSTKRFLIVSTTGVGDTLWGTPAMRALRKAYPDSYIAVLTNAAGAEVVKGNETANELFVFKRGAGNFFRLPVLVFSLRKKRFTKVFIFHASDRIIWPVAFLSGSPEIIGFRRQSKDMDFILTETVDADPAAHGISNRFLMLAAAGVIEKDESIEMHLDEDAEEEARSFLEGNGIAGREMLIGLHPGAQKPFKCWPAKKFVETGSLLRERYGCRIVITGNSDEKALAEEVAAAINGAVSAAGRLSLRGTAALIRIMSLFVTNDTGPMHIAFAMKTPVVALFSPTDPALCGPYRAGLVRVIQGEVACAKCIGKKCYNPVCLDQISPAEVMDAASALLGEQKTR